MTRKVFDESSVLPRFSDNEISFDLPIFRVARAPITSDQAPHTRIRKSSSRSLGGELSSPLIIGGPIRGMIIRPRLNRGRLVR